MKDRHAKDALVLFSFSHFAFTLTIFDWNETQLPRSVILPYDWGIRF